MFKTIFNKFVLFLFDLITLVIAIYSAFTLRQVCGYFENDAPTMTLFPAYGMIYFLLFASLIVQGHYSKRYDFWQETYHLLRATFLSMIIVLAVLTLVKEADQHSRFVLVSIFLIFMFLAPLQKYIVKRLLFHVGTWKLPSKIFGKDDFFEDHVYKNPYLGYVPCSNSKARTLFVSSSLGSDKLEQILHDALIEKQDVIFIPLVRNFNFTDAHIIHLFNARANLIIVENNLLNQTNLFLKFIIDFFFALVLLPLILISIGIIGILIKLDDGGNIFFTQPRLGKKSNVFTCYKFRTMKTDSNDLLEQYLTHNPDEKTFYEIYHKYKYDPRITKIGSFLRKTSLDELPQIFNVFKGEMSLIGPRPYLPSERSKIGQNADLILAVKPGITGLWQVSGRNDVDFKSRIDMDVWYVRNWSIWNDIVILIKTAQVVLRRKGAK